MYFLSLIDEKKTKSKELSNDILSRHRVTIRKLDKLIDNLVARFSAVIFGLLFYRQLEKVKNSLLKYHYNSVDKKFDSFDEEKTEIQWRINKIDNACRNTVTSNSNILIF